MPEGQIVSRYGLLVAVSGLAGSVGYQRRRDFSLRSFFDNSLSWFPAKSDPKPEVPEDSLDAVLASYEGAHSF